MAYFKKYQNKKIAIYGSGYIALEFAGIFNGLGAQTHLIYRSDLPLRGFDNDVRAHIATALTDRGVILHPETTIDQVTAENGGKQAHLSDGSRLAVDQIMAATGRRPNTANLGLDDFGVKLGKQGEIIVDDMFRPLHNRGEWKVGENYIFIEHGIDGEGSPILTNQKL